MERLRGYARDAGRDPAARWRVLGATHLSVNVSGFGNATPQGQIDTLRRVKALLE